MIDLSAAKRSLGVSSVCSRKIWLPVTGLPGLSRLTLGLRSYCNHSLSFEKMDWHFSLENYYSHALMGVVEFDGLAGNRSWACLFVAGSRPAPHTSASCGLASTPIRGFTLAGISAIFSVYPFEPPHMPLSEVHRSQNLKRTTQKESFLMRCRFSAAILGLFC